MTGPMIVTGPVIATRGAVVADRAAVTWRLVAPERADDGERERGSGTVLVLGLVAVTLLLIAAISVLVGAQSARAAAQVAADLGALAAAEQLAAAGIGTAPAVTSGAAHGPACMLARAVVTANRATLVGCTVLRGGVVRISAERSSGLGTARASARAGPS